jgi:hypothetical protein
MEPVQLRFVRGFLMGVLAGIMLVSMVGAVSAALEMFGR